MRGIFGLLHRDGRPVSKDTLAAMARGLHGAGASRHTIRTLDTCGLGECPAPDDAPAGDTTAWRAPAALAFAVSARLDARDELADALGLAASERQRATDAELVRRAVVRWGDAAPAHLIGDWAFAAWDAANRRLLLARDPQGVGTLYVFADARRVVFASALRALLAVPGIPKTLDERYLADVLTGWPSPDATCYAEVARLPIAHALVVTPTAVERRQYLDAADVQPLRLARDEDYVEACREILCRAVRDRLRGVRSGALALSGGLDSGAVAATLADVGAASRVHAFGHVPQFKGVELAGKTADESPYMAATAAAAGLASVRYVDSSRTSPVTGLARALDILGAPTAAASNQFWLIDLADAVREAGHDTLLTGQLGNLTISWGGLPGEVPWRALWRARQRRAALVALMPERWQNDLRYWRHQWKGSASDHGVVRRDAASLHARHAGGEVSSPVAAAETSIAHRLRRLRASKGEFAEIGLAPGVVLLDPTADLRLVKFCLSLPPSQFVSPAGERRWLARRLLDGRLPRDVVANTRRGRQAADLRQRLAAHPAEFETAFERFHANPLVREYLDLTALRRAWDAMCLNSDADGERTAGTVTRALMVGLFLTDVRL